MSRNRGVSHTALLLQQPLSCLELCVACHNLSQPHPLLAAGLVASHDIRAAFRNVSLLSPYDDTASTCSHSVHRRFYVLLVAAKNLEPSISITLPLLIRSILTSPQTLSMVGATKRHYGTPSPTNRQHTIDGAQRGTYQPDQPPAIYPPQLSIDSIVRLHNYTLDLMACTDLHADSLTPTRETGNLAKLLFPTCPTLGS